MHRWYDPHAGRWISEDPIGFAAGDANLYRYVGNEPTGARDPSGLWQRTEFSRVVRSTDEFGLDKKYNFSEKGWRGFAIAECDGESLENLAYMITGRSSDSISLTRQFGPIKKGDKIPVGQLLWKNEQRLRASVVYATSTFSKSVRFPDKGEKHFTGNRDECQGFNESDINSFFGTSATGVTDCDGAMVLALAKGLIDWLQPGECDTVFSDLSHVNMERFSLTANDAQLGDWGYIENHRSYGDYQPDGPFRGENVIKVGDDAFWGWPAGTMSLNDWEQFLLGEHNSGLPSGSPNATKIASWQNGSVKFLDVGDISERIFDHRRKRMPPSIFGLYP